MNSALAVDLVAAGIPPIQAEYLGYAELTTFDGSSGVPVSNNNILVTTAPGAASVTFAPASILNATYLTTCNAAEALLVRAPSSGTINGNSEVSTAQNLARMNVRISNLVWVSFLAA